MILFRHLFLVALLFASPVFADSEDQNEFELKGLIESLPAGGGVGSWRIGGISVDVVASTELETDEGPFVVGACVEVEGDLLANGTRQASEIKTEKPSKCGSGGSSGGGNGGGSGGGGSGGGSSGSGGNPQVREFELRGLIEALPAGGPGVGDWRIAGQTIMVTAATKLKQKDGPFRIGACVEVEGTAPAGGTRLAQEIKTKSDDDCGSGAVLKTELRGAVEQLPSGSSLVGDWLVNGVTVRVSATTEIDQEKGPVAVGSCVKVEGASQVDGSLDAVEVEVKSSSSGCGGLRAEPKEVKFEAAVRALPAGADFIGQWDVGGRSVTVNAMTKLDFDDRTPTVGQCVEVEGRMLGDGSLMATKIEEEDDGKCDSGGSVKLEIVGLVEQLPAAGLIGNWTVGGQSVVVTALTELETEEGPFVTGACVEVEGFDPGDGSIEATEVKAKEPGKCGQSGSAGAVLKFEGIVETAPSPGPVGQWRIAGRTVSVSTSTTIGEDDGPLGVGACVEVYGDPRPDGSVAASKIEVESSSGSCVSSQGALNAASLNAAGSVSPGEIVSLFGFGLGSADGTSLEIVDGRVTDDLGATRLLFDSEAAPLLFVSRNQINAVVPKSVAGKKTISVQVEYAGVWSNVIQLGVTSSSPGLFTLTQNGSGQVAALNFDDGAYSLNGAANPIERGDTLILYGTGFGLPSGDDGQVVLGPQALAGVDVRVTIGGVEAEVTYVGDAPGLVSGVVQLNVKIAEDTPVGSAVVVEVIVDGVKTTVATTAAVN